MYNCEVCSTSVHVLWGSGRFCSDRCAKSFSTKHKRREINEKISLALRKSPSVVVSRCESCKEEFTSSKVRKNCSRKCAAQVQRGKKKKSGEYRKPGSGGPRAGGGRSKVTEYVSIFGEKMKLNADEIRVAKILDESGLNWKRNWVGFKYDSNRKFYPDFYVVDLDLYIEYKGWLTDAMRKKMKNSNIDNLLIVVSNDPRFANDGITIENFEHELRRS